MGYVQGFLGGVVADEPRAALVGRDILASGGSAADAVTAMYFALAVTLPSRAGLGGSGACVAFDAQSGKTEALDFNAQAFPQPIPVPANPRGFFALQARYGQLLWREVVTPGEQLARFGFPASRALIGDLRDANPFVLATPDMHGLFTRDAIAQQSLATLREGDILKQPDLATTLGLLRARGVGPFYIGPFARTLVDGVKNAGGALTSEDLRRYTPRIRAAARVALGNDVVYFAPSPNGTSVAATMFAMVQKNDRFKTQDNAGQAQLMTRIAQRAFAQHNLTQPPLAPSQRAHSATAFAAVDAHANAVSCAVSMNAPFGIGRVAQGTGVLLAAPTFANGGSPAPSAMLAVNENSKEFKFAAAASGGATAPTALVGVAARVLLAKESLATALAAPRSSFAGAADIGLVNALSCPGGLPGKPNLCRIATDPRGAGLAAGSLH